ncbi:TPA: single-stranded DNA-binding protein [Candidatus Poribacteria bacterium]|nr:single-stranded DNA-binding protein [Candidatus Poribacteria bacterium]
MNVNKVMLLGRLTRDPEVKYSTSGNAFCAWGMAINRYYNSENGERQQEVCFVDCKAFGRQAEIVGQYVAKGNPLFVEGRLSFYQYETENGERRNKLSVIAERIQLMGQNMFASLTDDSVLRSAPPENMEHPDEEAKEAQPQQASPETPTEGEVTDAEGLLSDGTADDIPF